MPYPNETPFTKTPYPSSGNVSSAAEEAYRSGIPDGYLEILVKALSDENADGTLQDSFQVSDDGGLDIEVSAGQGFVGGLVIGSNTPTAKAGLTDNTTNYIYLKTTATTKRDRTFTVEASLSGAGMSDAILIASVVTLAGAIYSISNAPANRAPYIPPILNPSTISDIPGWRVVAPTGGMYTDPRAAIQACNAGDTVLICPGTYELTATITIPANNINIIGAGKYSAILNNTTASDQTVIDLNSHSGIAIHNLSITCHASNLARAIWEDVSGVDNLRCLDLYISGPGLFMGIDVAGSNRVQIERCHTVIGGAYAHIHLINCSNALIRANLCVRASGAGYGIVIISSTSSLIAQNVCEISFSNATLAICVKQSSSISVIGNIINVTVPGASMIYLWVWADSVSAANIIIQGNLIISTGGVGFGIMLQTTNPRNLDDVIVNGNRLVALGTGISIADARVRYTMVHDNQYRGCTAGLSDAGTSTNAADNV
jgi:hypothetical protein